VLKELAEDDLGMVPVLNRTLLRVAATPVSATVPEDVEEGSAVASPLFALVSRHWSGPRTAPMTAASVSAAGQAAVELMEVTPKLTRGIKRALRDAYRRGTTPDEQARAMKAVFRVVRRLNRQDASEAFRVYGELKRLGALGVEERYLSELTHPWWGKMHGAMFQGKAMLGLAERAKGAKVALTRMTLEARRNLRQVHGTPFNRVDGEIEYASRSVACEMKNWGKRWTTFPPTSGRLKKAYDAFRKQFLERAAESGPNFVSDYYYEIAASFCGGGSNRAKCLQQVQAEMARLLRDESAELKRLMNAVGVPDASDLARRYKQTTGLADKVGDIFKDPWER
jgi:hypothetical protein